MLSAGKSRRNAGSYSLSRSKQSGIVMVIGMIAMVALLAMAGLAMDSGHMLINKTRLQNTADAAALNAAKVYDLTSNIGNAQTAVTTAINLNGDMPGQKEMKDAIADGTISVSTQFSNTLVPFVPTLTPGDAWFVRVTMTNFRMPAFLVRVVGVNTLTVAASAVAGPSPPIVKNVCDLAPVMLCGSEDTNPDDDEYFGYTENGVSIVKYTAGSNKCDAEEDCISDTCPPGDKNNPEATCVLECEAEQYCVGPGNFQLIRLPGNTGGADVRVAAAGGYESGCLSAGENMNTEPGNTVGPTVQGFNSRFGDYQGPLSADDYPADCDTTTVPAPPLTLKDPDTEDDDPTEYIFYGDTQISGLDPLPALPVGFAGFTAYQTSSETTNCVPPPEPEPSPVGRRLMTVPIGNCTGSVNGAGQVPVLGFACVYLVQPVEQHGSTSHVYIQFVSECTADGMFSKDPIATTAPTRIILYKDPSRVDS